MHLSSFRPDDISDLHIITAHTKKEEGTKYFRLLEENEKIKSGKVPLDGTLVDMIESHRI